MSESRTVEMNGVRMLETLPGQRYKEGTYTAILEESFGKVIEGICPTCGYELRPSTGYCWDCRVNWQASTQETERGTVKTIKLLDRMAGLLTWSLAPSVWGGPIDG